MIELIKMNDKFAKVEDFMTKFGQEVRSPCNPDVLPGSPKTQLRESLISEELMELEESIFDLDDVEIADALTDIVYVVIGAFHDFGLELDKKNYMNGVFECKNVVNGISSADKFEMEIIVNPFLEKYVDLMACDFGDYDQDMMQINMTYFLSSIVNLCNKFNIPLDKCFDEVHRSNMSKLSEDGLPIYREDGKILKGPNYFKPDLKTIVTQHMKKFDNA